MPTGNLPAEGKKLWEEVYQKAKKGSCKGDEACAAGSAWKAVHNAGWKKDAKGEWHKSEVFTEFSLRIDRASYDKATNERRVRAVASDTETDSRGDSMSLELFNDFIDRIKKNEPVPEEFQSEFWKGGEPYFSVSHYPDGNGKTVPGTIDATYVDGNFLKSKGKFFDTPLGRKCFEAVCEDLYGENKSATDNKVRISIAFLDYMHKHKSNGFIFDRLNSKVPYCPQCIMELTEGENQGKVFLKGHLIHEALTRVPVNTRTSMEVDKSMADKVLTRKDDAASIVGEELADELEEQAEVIGKSEALVIRSDDEKVEKAMEEAPGDAEEDCTDPKTGEVDPDCMAKKTGEIDDSKASKPKKKVPASKTTEDEPEDKEEDKAEIIRSIVREVLAETKPEPKPEPVAPHPLDAYFSEFKSKFDEVINSNVAEDMKLQMVQEPFTILGNGIVSVVKSSIKPVAPEVKGQMDLVNALSQIMNPIAQKLDLVLTQLATPPIERTVPTIPQRRSIPPVVLQQPVAPQQPVTKSETPNLRKLIEKTT